MVAFVLKVSSGVAEPKFQPLEVKKPKTVLTYQEASPSGYYNNAYVTVQ